MSIDITMTILSILLMGGNFLFPAEIVHEILGTGLFVLWSVHIFLNRRWYASIAQASKSITSTNANDRRAYGAIFKGKIQSLSRNADFQQLRHFNLHNFFDDKRNHSFKSAFYFFEYSERSWVCQNRAFACKPLVLSFYVAAYRNACGDYYK